MTKNPLLETKDLSISLKKNNREYCVVSNLAFSLEKKRCLAIVGESGSGKTLSALALLQLLPKPPFLPPEGEVWYSGKNLLSLPKKDIRSIRGNRIAIIFQNPLATFNPVYKIEYQLKEVLYSHTYLSQIQAKELILETLEKVSLPNPEECLKSYPYQLSGGMLQRIAIAMALLCKPDILIADEPTTALDVSVQHQILSLLKHLQDSTGMALLIITHDIGVVSEIADDVVVLYAGQAVEQASVYTLFNNMKHPYTQALFESQPGLLSRSKKLQTIEGHVPSFANYPEGCRFFPRCKKKISGCKYIKTLPLKTIEVDHKVRCLLYDNE